jgi:protein-S-isoprenylcysteine O-methyltransferase Ste14
MSEFLARRRIALSRAAAVVLGIALLGVTSRMAEGSAGHDLFKVLSYVLLIVAVLGRTWCSVYIGGHKGREVISAGPYSVVRNPLYVFSFLGVTGIGLASGTITVPIVLCLLFVAYYSAVVRHEERVLSEALGQAYRDYLARVPRWLPDFRLWRDDQYAQVRPRAVYVTMRDSAWFFVALPGFEAIERLQAMGYLPVLFHLP